MIWSAQIKFIGIALGAAVLAASHWYAYETGNTTGRNAVLAKSQQAYIDVLLQRTQENVALAQTYQQQAKKANQDHEQELADIRAAAARTAGQRVRINRNTFCSAAGAPQAAPSGSPGPADPGAAFLPDTFAADLRQLAIRADEVTAALRTLKARSQGCFE